MRCEGYLKLCERSREVYLIRSIAAVLTWDLETYIPSKAVEYRADQLGYLEAKAHTLFTDTSVGDWLAAAEQYGFNPDSEEYANVREWRRSYDRATKIPVSLVEEFEKTRTVAREAWAGARAESRFSQFAPHLEKIVELTRRKADFWGFVESPYDALIEEYEPGVTAQEVKQILEELRGALVNLLAEIPAESVPENFLDGRYPIPAQQ